MTVPRPFDLIVAGVGGQGSLFASQVIAQAAFQQGISVRVAESYGVAQRGGSVYSQIRLGHDVCGPLIPKGGCDVVVGLEPIEALRRAAEYLAPGGEVILNTVVQAPLETKMGEQPDLDAATIRSELNKLKPRTVLELDAQAIAAEAGGPATANVVMLGALLCLDRFPLTYEAMSQALEAVGSSKHIEANLHSLAAGRTHGKDFIQQLDLLPAEST